MTTLFKIWAPTENQLSSFHGKINKKECIIALLNVNSLPSKFIAIKEWLVDGVFDILCIQETKINSTFSNSQFL